MMRALTITYNKTDEDLPVMKVIDSDTLICSTTVLNVFTGEKAEQLYKELTGQNVIVKTEQRNEE